MTFTTQNPNLQFTRNPGLRTRTDGIVLHHLAANVPVQTVHSWHLGRGWVGIGYHFQVDKDGTIWQGRPINWVGGHTNPPPGINSSTIGIAVQGDYHTVSRTMPDAQYNALVWLIRHLQEQYGNLRIQGHRDLAPTACPGEYFPMDEVLKLEFRNGSVVEEETDAMKEQRVRELIEEVVWDILTGSGTTPAPWAEGELAEAVKAGITDGQRPRGFTTRQEAAIMNVRTMKAVREE